VQANGVSSFNGDNVVLFVDIYMPSDVMEIELGLSGLPSRCAGDSHHAADVCPAPRFMLDLSL
jgi:hypothetical protein